MSEPFPVPDGWRKTRLQSLLYRPLAYGVLKPGDFVPAGVPILRIQDLRSGSLDPAALHRVSEALHREYKRTALNPGDLIVSLVGTIGKVLEIPQWLANGNVSRAFGVLGIKREHWRDYIRHYLTSDGVQAWFGEEAQGNAQKVLNLNVFRGLEVLLPPLPEQRKIAEVLSSVDAAIEKTEALIEKLRDLKQAMMQELLTKGIGHTRFKDSPIGRIPAEWEVVRLGEASVEVLDGDRGKEYPKEKDFKGAGHCLFLSAKNVTKEGFRFDERVFVGKNRHERMGKGELERDDIVITTRGTLGNIALYDCLVPYQTVRINSGMAILRTRGSIDSRYLYQLLRAGVVQEQIRLAAFGSAQPQLTIGILKRLRVPLPPTGEQQIILSSLLSCGNRTRSAIMRFHQLHILKKALMQDLLTGRVRVKV